jgi:hypothetical protein
VLSDYFFQSDANAEEKNKKGFRSNFLFKHALITFGCAWVLSFDINFFFCALGIALSHYLIDGFKNRFNVTKYAFYIEQTLHLFVIFGGVWLFNTYFISHKIIPITLTTKTLFILLSYAICMKPGNVFIHETIKTANIKSISNTDTELENAGKLIGTLERILVLTFVIIGKLEVVGFLIAAKSILRYKDTNTIKTEYVLIGTMLSFGLAMMLGLIANQF